MQTHVKVVGVLFLACGALGLLGALFLMLTFGTAAQVVDATADPEKAALVVSILGTFGTALVFLALALSVPGMIAGWGILTLRPWARVLGLVLSVLNLIWIPIGTVVGVYGLWVLLHNDTERLFAAPPAGPPVPTP
jgi:hypothetical protein